MIRMSTEKSFIISKGNVFKQNTIDTAFDSDSRRLYLNIVQNIESLNVKLLKELSNDCKAVVVDFDFYNGNNLIEIECYLENELSLNGFIGFIWSDKPCSIEVNDIVYRRLIKSLNLNANDLRGIIYKGKEDGKSPYQSLKESGYIKDPMDEFF
jgi:hypothetical protein